MSNGRPMTTTRRSDIYARGRTLTDRQHRQLVRMAAREEYRAMGWLPHGGSGLPVRRPHPHARGAR